MRIKTLKIAALLMFATAFFSSCEKKEIVAGCYDKDLYERSKDIPCTKDCPGITGCDDKFYCNECEAAKNGIRKKN